MGVMPATRIGSISFRGQTSGAARSVGQPHCPCAAPGKGLTVVEGPAKPTRAGGRATGISWGSSSLTAGRTAPGGATGDGRLQNRNETRPTSSDDGATLRSVGRGMKRLTRAEQGQTWPMKCLRQARVGR